MAILYIIESSVIGPAYLRQAAREFGLEVTFLSKVSNQEGDALRQMLAGRVLQCNTEDGDAMAALIREDTDQRDLAGVVTFLDSRLDVCAALCRALTVNGVDQAIGVIKSKAVVNSLIPEYVPRSLHFDAREAPAADLRKMLREARHGLIVKPAFAAGAKGYREVATEAQLLPAEQLVDKQLSPALKPHDLVVQEKIVGELVSLEGFVTKGIPCFLGATGRRKRGNSESVFIFPYDDRVDPCALTKAKEAVLALVERSGYENGFFHSEFILDGAEAWLIDGHVPATIDWNRPLTPSLGIAYGLPQRGYLLGVEGLENPASRHTMAQNLGCEVEAMGESNWAWVGLLAGTQADVLADVARLRLRTNFGLVAPAWYGVDDFLEKTQ